jgi:hypothetical protein
VLLSHISLRAYAVLTRTLANKDDTPTKGANEKSEHGTSSHPTSDTSLKRRRVSHKRQTIEGNDEGEDEDEDCNHKKQRTDVDCDSTGPEKPLACVFNKYDDYHFGVDDPRQEYKSCGTFKTLIVGHFKLLFLIPQRKCIG